MRNLFMLLIILSFGITVAKADDVEVTVIKKSVNFNRAEISKEAVEALTQGKINEYIDPESKQEAEYTSLDFWNFPVKVMVTETTNRFTFDDGKIKKDYILEDKISRHTWEIELCWRIVPLILLLLFFIQKKGGLDYLSLGAGACFAIGTSAYLIHRLGWQGANMDDYLVYIFILIALLYAIRILLPKPKEEEPVILSNLLKKRPAPRKKQKVIGVVAQYQERV